MNENMTMRILLAMIVSGVIYAEQKPYYKELDDVGNWMAFHRIENGYEKTPVVYRSPVPSDEVWGRDDKKEERKGYAIKLTAKGRALSLSKELLYGLVDISDVRYRTDGESTVIYIIGGDAAGSYRCILRVSGNVASRYVQHGEMGEEMHEYRTFKNGSLATLDKHFEYHE